eukprot:1136256-Pelagomonas_calceolata.AAC.3
MWVTSRVGLGNATYHVFFLCCVPGTTTYGFSPATKKVNAHIDTWDLTDEQDWFSVDGASVIAQQILESSLVPGPQEEGRDGVPQLSLAPGPPPGPGGGPVQGHQFQRALGAGGPQGLAQGHQVGRIAAQHFER